MNGKEPVVPAVQVGDLAGGMLAALTIIALYMSRQRNEAQRIDASMLDALLSWLIIPLALHHDGTPSILAGEFPFYRLYRTRDSGFLAVAAIGQFWEGLCKLINRPDLLRDQFAPEPQRSEVIEAIQTVMATKTKDEWFQIMRETNSHVCPSSP